MSILNDNQCKLLQMRRVVTDLYNEGFEESKFKGSPVTSMREDSEIRNMGLEKQEIAAKLLKILNS